VKKPAPSIALFVLLGAVVACSGDGGSVNMPGDSGVAVDGSRACTACDAGVADVATADADIADTAHDGEGLDALATDIEAGAHPGPFLCSVDEPPDSGQRVVTCGAGAFDASAPVCLFSACLTGGLEVAFSGDVSCGAFGTNALDWGNNDPQKGPNTLLDFTFPTNIPVDAVGNFTGTVGVTEVLGSDGGSRVWKTPPGACTLTIASSTCAPDFVDPTRRILTGTGKCTQAATPQAANTAPPVNVGGFTFSGYFAP
jgi:hypothetical protein